MKYLSPIELVVLQGTPFCNLNCQYCDLSPASRRLRLEMKPDLIDRVFIELFTSGLLASEVMVVWHSGEPLTLPPSYYEAAINQIERLREIHASAEVSVVYDIQTNAVLINQEWCDLFKRHAHHLKIGVSCDGPAEMHDAFRVNWGHKPSHAKVVRGMDLLAANGIAYKVIAVVTKKTLESPKAFIDFFKARKEQLRGFHFNILASGSGASGDLSYEAADRERYYQFYRTLLDLNSEDKGRISIQNFTHGLARIVQASGAVENSVMRESSAPLKSLNVDANGYITSCYAGLAIETLPDEYGDGMGLALGNIKDTPLLEMVRSEKLARIISDFERSSDFCATNCEYGSVCTGGFEITKRLAHGDFAAGETPECVIHVKALTDALLDDLEHHMGSEKLQMETV